MAASTPENRVKTLVKRLLATYKNLYSNWPVPYGYGTSTLDCIICFRGKFVGVETKAPGKTPTALQKAVIEQMSAAGAAVFVIDGPEGVAKLREYLDDLAAVPSQPEA